ncbi:hypothetical protein ElyMa_003969000 [Elysia marginata]|uniref:Uncharacterized protein n=1 Tax=Elysia marginata TaxID=1093978 RepID=A0AAV4FYS5_9GAST|nr:hypothetical protein ElyMa_003969000 [Elysia marginata]
MVDQKLFILLLASTCLWIGRVRCAPSSHAIEKCIGNDRTDECRWIFENPTMSQCVTNSGSGERILNLYDKCMKIGCGVITCAEVQDEIVQAGCDKLRRIEELSSFMDDCTV